MKTILPEDFVEALRASRGAGKVPCYLFYSSLLGGCVRDPALMVLPFDDHLAHRGDGVFETMKCVGGAVYNLDAHLQRLQRSAYQIGLTFRHGPEALRAKVLEVLAEAGQADCSVRVVLSRGPGGMGVSPRECPATALYVLVYGAGRPFMEAHPAGATLRLSAVPAKHPDFATAKTCNYIPNVLMRMEAEAWGVDFVVGADGQGHITEGATENVGIVSKGGTLAFPPLDSVLAGTTMLRVAELARPLEAAGLIKGVLFRPIRVEELAQAREILVVGTTLNVASAVEWEGRPVGDGAPGPVGRALDAALAEDCRVNPALRTLYLPQKDSP